MAKCFVSLVILGLFALVGCQPQSGPSAVVDAMPAPNFKGPALQDDLSHPAHLAAAPSHPVQQVHAPAPHAVVAVAHGKPHGDTPADWTPVAHPNSWTWIVVHHSATPTGGASAFDKMHKAKGWDELGYHFVVGNGTDTRDGQIEVGTRWPKQKWGAHTKTPDNQFNEHGIGICMVGNFDVARPSDVQLKSLAKLVSYLMKTYHIPADHVLGHRDCKSTDCPGKFVNIAQVRKLSVQMLADAGDSIPADPHHAVLAQGEMLHDEKSVVSR